MCYFPFEILILKYCSLFQSIHVIWSVWEDVTCSECDMRGKWHIENVECGMYRIWDVQDVGCWGCGMFEMWDVQDVGCAGCRMFGMWDVRDVGCSGCGMFGMWDVWDVGCLGCGMWDVGCLSGCGMLIYKMPRSRTELEYLGISYRIFRNVQEVFKGILQRKKILFNGSCSI